MDRRPEGGFLARGEPWWVILAGGRTGETLIGVTPMLVEHLGNHIAECKVRNVFCVSLQCLACSILLGCIVGPRLWRRLAASARYRRMCLGMVGNGRSLGQGLTHTLLCYCRLTCLLYILLISYRLLTVHRAPCSLEYTRAVRVRRFSRTLSHVSALQPPTWT